MAQKPTFEIKFGEAHRSQEKARIGIFGLSGCGKTKTGLIIAKTFQEKLAPDKRFAVIDTEHGRVSLYADEFKKDDGSPWFFSYPLGAPYSPDHYIAAIQKAQSLGAQVLLIDSISHEWFAEGGVQQIVDEAAARQFGGNKFSGWAVGTPAHNAFMEAMLGCTMHLIVTMRAKTEWAKDEQNRPVKVGLGPIQRDNIEYEFDLCFNQLIDHSIVVSKSRVRPIPVGLETALTEQVTADMASMILDWQLEGAPAPDPDPDAAKKQDAAAEAPQAAPADTSAGDQRDADDKAELEEGDRAAAAPEAAPAPEPAAEAPAPEPAAEPAAEAPAEAPAEANNSPEEEAATVAALEELAEGAAAETVSDKIKPATKGKITKALKDLQEQHGDYKPTPDAPPTNWEERLLSKLAEMPWNPAKKSKIEDLTDAEGEELVKTITATVNTVNEKKLEQQQAAAQQSLA